jgi:hypothetical protein
VNVQQTRITAKLFTVNTKRKETQESNFIFALYTSGKESLVHNQRRSAELRKPRKKKKWIII